MDELRVSLMCEAKFEAGKFLAPDTAWVKLRRLAPDNVTGLRGRTDHGDILVEYVEVDCSRLCKTMPSAAEPRNFCCDESNPTFDPAKPYAIPNEDNHCRLADRDKDRGKKCEVRSSDQLEMEQHAFDPHSYEIPGDCGVIGTGNYGLGQAGQAIVNGFDVDFMNQLMVGVSFLEGTGPKWLDFHQTQTACLSFMVQVVFIPCRAKPLRNRDGWKYCCGRLWNDR